MDVKPISHFLAGAIIGALLILLSLALNFTGLNTGRSLAYLSPLLLLVGVAFFSYLHGRGAEEPLGFGGVFSYGFKASAITTLLFIAFQVAFFLVFPEYRQKMEDISRTEMMAQGLPPEQVSQGMEFVRRFFWPLTIGGTLFNNMFFGAIGSLLGAALASRKRA